MHNTSAATRQVSSFSTNSGTVSLMSNSPANTITNNTTTRLMSTVLIVRKPSVLFTPPYPGRSTSTVPPTNSGDFTTHHDHNTTTILMSTVLMVRKPSVLFTPPYPGRSTSTVPPTNPGNWIILSNSSGKRIITTTRQCCLGVLTARMTQPLRQVGSHGTCQPLEGSCEAPAASGPPGLHTTARELHTCTIEGPGASKHHQNSTRRHPERHKKSETVAGKGKQKREILGSHPSEPHPSGPHTSGPHLSGVCSSMLCFFILLFPFGQSWSNKDGQSRSNFFGQSRFGQSRKHQQSEGPSTCGDARCPLRGNVNVVHVCVTASPVEGGRRLHIIRANGHLWVFSTPFSWSRVRHGRMSLVSWISAMKRGVKFRV